MLLWQECHRSDATFLLYPIKWLMILFVPLFSWLRWCLSVFFVVKLPLLLSWLINVLLSWSYASTLFLIKLSVYSFINMYELTVFPFYSGLYNLLHNVILVHKISYIWPPHPMHNFVLYPYTIFPSILSSFLLPGPTRCSIPACTFLPQPWISHFLKEPWLILVENGFRNQDLGH